MDSRTRRYEISRPKLIPQPSQLPRPPPPPPPPPPPLQQIPPATHNLQTVEQQPWVTVAARPLSDIRELSEPSLMDNVVRPYPSTQFRHDRNASRAGSQPRLDAASQAESTPIAQPQTSTLGLRPPQEGGSSSYSSTPERLSFYSIPQSSVPRRSSSQHDHAQRQPRTHTRNSSIGSKPQATSAPPIQRGHSIPNRGAGRSPVKEAGLRTDPITSDTARRLPSQTFVRNPPPNDILDFPTYKHPRVRLELQVSAPLFVGGGSVEGYLRVTVDDNEHVKHRRSLSIGAVSMDLLGLEEVDGSRKSTFLALATELVDTRHPPPVNMVQPANALFADDKFWPLVPSCSALPFLISLPLDTGPPPFQSKRAQIRFTLSATAFLRDAGKHYRVRTSQEVQVLPTYDPEKALTSLPSPLTASDETTVARSTQHETVKVTAGLHRQVWVSGSSIFVDVHVSNRCRKPVKRLELTLERDLLCYRHAAAATMDKSVSQARIFESNEQVMVARSCFKAGTLGWNGVGPHMSDARTCELELPRGHATVRCGKYFEVRYFLNVVASLSNSKVVSVQLPIILIHMNSLDVVPNSVAQVAAAIEEKRNHRQLSHSRSRKAEAAHSRQRSISSPRATPDLKRRPTYVQGRAFAAPRQQSLDRQREHRADMDELRHVLDSSPRKHPPQTAKTLTIKKVGSSVSLGTLHLAGASTETLGVLGAMSYQTSPRDRQAGRGCKTRNNNDEVDHLRHRLRRIGSLESFRSKNSTGTSKSKENENRVPQLSRTASHQQIAPHTLGLSTTTRQVSLDTPASERSATAMSFREKMDRSRFQFKAVRRKASGGLRERGLQWWEGVRGGRDRQRERAGWI